MKWFKHDSDSSIDAKLQELLLDYGATGYGLYWYCVELIAKNVTPKNITFELEHDVRIISRNLNLSLKETKDMMQKMVDLGLFDVTQNNKIACINLAYRLDDTMRKGNQINEIVNNFKESEKLRETPSNSGKVLLDTDIDIDKEVDKEKKRMTKSLSCPFDDLLNLYHECMPGNPRVVKLSSERKVAMKERWIETVKGIKPTFDFSTVDDGLKQWKTFFEVCNQSDFLTGKCKPRDGQESPFIADFDFIFNKTKFLRILENKYHRP